MLTGLHRAYRALYLLNWIYRYFHEPGYRHWIVWISGTVQTIFYCDFFYYYVKSWKNNERLKSAPCHVFFPLSSHASPPSPAVDGGSSWVHAD